MWYFCSSFYNNWIILGFIKHLFECTKLENRFCVTTYITNVKNRQSDFYLTNIFLWHFPVRYTDSRWFLFKKYINILLFKHFLVLPIIRNSNMFIKKFGIYSRKTIRRLVTSLHKWLPLSKRSFNNWILK